MNDQTLERLSKNPHYKMSAKQKAAARKPMVEFGSPPIHNSAIDMHPTSVIKKDREKKNEKQTK